MIREVNKRIDSNTEVRIRSCSDRLHYGFEHDDLIFHLKRHRNQWYWICVKANVAKLENNFPTPKGHSTFKKALKWAIRYFEVVQATNYMELVGYLTKGTIEPVIAA